MPNILVNDLQMYYEQLGNGEPIIFLHGNYSRGILTFASQILDFQTRYTCYFPDLRGHGRTRCTSLEWNTPQLAEDISAFMEQFRLSQAHFIGYGLGAHVGLYLAVDFPIKVASLTTIGTSGFSDPVKEPAEGEWLFELGARELIQQMTERHHEAHQGNCFEFMRQNAKNERMYPQLTEDQLSGISCPALFISGEHDPFVGEEKLKRLCTLVRGSEALIVPGCSHRPHMLRENPVLVNDTILDFIASHPIRLSYPNPNNQSIRNFRWGHAKG
ncbi:alpha/beta fold hydrolase [Paenibacillus senegalensis]|uniref:alpha/beta fold hydrolase n=1 Tax=Paenibacillus senegalensis TaxID=1465766 RepID=UPI0002899F43|nr:alpha/beta hydrolase [Paenibacillus senegalensis]